MAFTMDSKLEFLRLLNTEPPTVDWSFEFTEYSSEVAEINNRKDPQFLHTDPMDPQVIYLTGRHEGYASIMRFHKRSA